MLELSGGVPVGASVPLAVRGDLQSLLEVLSTPPVVVQALGPFTGVLCPASLAQTVKRQLVLILDQQQLSRLLGYADNQ